MCVSRTYSSRCTRDACERCFRGRFWVKALVMGLVLPSEALRRAVLDVAALGLHWRTATGLQSCPACVVEAVGCPSLSCPEVRCGDCHGEAVTVLILAVAGVAVVALLVGFACGGLCGLAVGRYSTKVIVERPAPSSKAAAVEAVRDAPFPSAVVAAPPTGFVTPSSRYGAGAGHQ